LTDKKLKQKTFTAITIISGEGWSGHCSGTKNEFFWLSDVDQVSFIIFETMCSTSESYKFNISILF
jgi:hypothetical protein